MDSRGNCVLLCLVLLSFQAAAFDVSHSAVSRIRSEVVLDSVQGLTEREPVSFNDPIDFDAGNNRTENADSDSVVLEGVLEVELPLRPDQSDDAEHDGDWNQGANSGKSNDVLVLVRQTLRQYQALPLVDLPPCISLLPPDRSTARPGERVNFVLPFSNVHLIDYFISEVTLVANATRHHRPHVVCSDVRGSHPGKPRCPPINRAEADSEEGWMDLTFTVPAGLQGPIEMQVSGFWQTWELPPARIRLISPALTIDSSASKHAKGPTPLIGLAHPLANAVFRIGDPVRTVLVFHRADLIAYRHVEVSLVAPDALPSGAAYPRSVVQFVCSPDDAHTSDPCPAPYLSRLAPDTGELALEFDLRPNMHRFTGTALFHVRALWSPRERSSAPEVHLFNVTLTPIQVSNLP